MAKYLKLLKVVSKADGDVYVFDEVPPTPADLDAMNKTAFDKLNPNRPKPPADTIKPGAAKLP